MNLIVPNQTNLPSSVGPMHRFQKYTSYAQHCYRQTSTTSTSEGGHILISHVVHVPYCVQIECQTSIRHVQPTFTDFTNAYLSQRINWLHSSDGLLRHHHPIPIILHSRLWHHWTRIGSNSWLSIEIAGKYQRIRVKWVKVPHRGKAPPHPNTNLVFEWFHLMSNDGKVFMSQTNLSWITICKIAHVCIFYVFTRGGALPRGRFAPCYSMSASLRHQNSAKLPPTTL